MPQLSRCRTGQPSWLHRHDRNRRTRVLASRCALRGDAPSCCGLSDTSAGKESARVRPGDPSVGRSQTRPAQETTISQKPTLYTGSRSDPLPRRPHRHRKPEFRPYRRSARGHTARRPREVKCARGVHAGLGVRRCRPLTSSMGIPSSASRRLWAARRTPMASASSSSRGVLSGWLQQELVKQPAGDAATRVSCPCRRCGHANKRHGPHVTGRGAGGSVDKRPPLARVTVSGARDPAPHRPRIGRPASPALRTPCLCSLRRRQIRKI